jgi:hypothetical protein
MIDVGKLDLHEAAKAALAYTKDLEISHDVEWHIYVDGSWKDDNERAAFAVVSTTVHANGDADFKGAFGGPVEADNAHRMSVADVQDFEKLLQDASDAELSRNQVCQQRRWQSFGRLLGSYDVQTHRK